MAKLSEAAGHEEARVRESQEIYLSTYLGVPDPLICLIGAIGNHNSPMVGATSALWYSISKHWPGPQNLFNA